MKIYPSCHWARGRETPWRGRQSITGPHRDKRNTLTPRDNLESPVNLTCMFLDGGRKPGYPERTYEYTGRTCRLHTERTSQESDLEPCCVATVLTTTPPCSPTSKMSKLHFLILCFVVVGVNFTRCSDYVLKCINWFPKIWAFNWMLCIHMQTTIIYTAKVRRQW